MTRIRSLAALLGILAASPLLRARAQSLPTDSTPKLTFGAFVDGYFAWDFGRPPSLDRSFIGGAPFTTQPSRHNEFNVNLAFVEAKLDAPHYRGRLALQAGTSVQSNYAGEPSNGSVSGPSLSRMLQEAVVGVKVAEDLWVDGGIFYSNVGMESWASRDNLSYTRSLVADYSPYYQSGVKLTWTPTAKFTARLDVVNGWQNISENNSGKAGGVRLDYTPSSASTLSYYNLLSSEAGTKLRVFNGIGAKHTAGRLTLLGEFDVGSQSRADGDDRAAWYGWTAIARIQSTPTAALVLRAEGYDDEEQVIAGTGSYSVGSRGPLAPNAPLRALGGSLGVDVTPYARVAWRTELRGWRNRDAIFPDGTNGAPSRSSVVATTSLSLTF